MRNSAPIGSTQPGQGQSGQAAASQAPAAPSLPAGDRGILGTDLMTELMGTVPGFGGRKVYVGFNGDRAFCDLKLGYVNIPGLPPARRIPTRIAMEIRGFAMHEASHILWTDEDFMQNGRTAEEKKTPLLHEVWNAIEDYMIERNFLEIYPGAHKNFTATEVRCCHSYFEGYNKHPDKAKDLRIVGPVALTWCRAIHFGLKTTLSQDALNTLPHSLQQRVWDWFDQILDVESTQDCWAHAKAIYADIQANPYDPADPPADPNHNPQAGQGQGQGQSQGQGGGQPQPGGGVGQTNGAASADPQDAQTGQQGPEPIKVGHNIADSFEAGGLAAESADVRSFASLSSLTGGPYQAQLGDTAGAQKLDAVRQRTAATTGEVSRSLKRALKSVTRARWRGGRYDGPRIDHARLAQVLTGNAEIYRKKHEGEKIDTAVQVLIDCSGSMNGAELGICQEMATVFNDAFAGTPIKVEILGFTSVGEAHLPEQAKIMAQAIRQNDPDNPVQLRAVELYEFKHFDASTQVSNITIGNMCNVRCGGTPTGEAIFQAHDRLSRRPERRHVMFVLTDGAPDCQTSCAKAVQAVRASDATCIGIGIGTNAVKRAFGDDHVQINETRDLPAVMLNRMASLLLGDRFKQGKRATPARMAARLTG